MKFVCQVCVSTSLSHSSIIITADLSVESRRAAFLPKTTGCVWEVSQANYASFNNVTNMKGSQISYIPCRFERAG